LISIIVKAEAIRVCQNKVYFHIFSDILIMKIRRDEGETTVINLFISLLTVYLVVGLFVSVYAKVVGKINLAGMVLVALFWPLFILTGLKSGALPGSSQKRLP
jgi:hypothetical protein